jgi:hypothetical protein
VYLLLSISQQTPNYTALSMRRRIWLHQILHSSRRANGGDCSERILGAGVAIAGPPTNARRYQTNIKQTTNNEQIKLAHSVVVW